MGRFGRTQTLYMPGLGIVSRSFDDEHYLEQSLRLRDVTHLAIGAHPDDVEFMAWQGIQKCYNSKRYNFASVVITDGANSARTGKYADYTNEQMAEVRLQELWKVADAGHYTASYSLGYTSKDLEDLGTVAGVVADLLMIIGDTQPEVIYTHNLADRHPRHITTFASVLRTLRSYGKYDSFKKFIGCEVWRDLDWLTGKARLETNVSRHEKVMRALMGLHDSQIAGGKKYDEACVGRRQAHATYSDAYSVDTSALTEVTMDMTPLAYDYSMTPAEYFKRLNQQFCDDVLQRLETAGEIATTKHYYM